MREFEITTTPHPIGGNQAIYKMKNGLGASVVPEFDMFFDSNEPKHRIVRGQYEIAVIRFPIIGDSDWHICYCTPVTDDVIRHLAEHEVYDKLIEIDSLPETECKCGERGK